MENSQHEVSNPSPPAVPIPPVLAPVLMVVFWMLLGGSAGIKIMESIWHFLGVEAGEMTVAVPVGGAAGALVGALLGLIKDPRLLVLLMAMFAGASAGGVAGQLLWGDIGQIGGQFTGTLVGGMAWAIWLWVGAGKIPNAKPPTSSCQGIGPEQEAIQGVHEKCHECS